MKTRADPCRPRACHFNLGLNLSATYIRMVLDHPVCLQMTWSHPALGSSGKVGLDFKHKTLIVSFW
ncbi:hypothetical protein ACRRTK_009844 [Alexandromys fortis]